MMRFAVAKANQCLARIEDVEIFKKALLYPGQSCSTLEISPLPYTVIVEGLSADNVAFKVSVGFIIGPNANEYDSLLKYAKLVSTSPSHSENLKNFVYSIINGEARVVLATMNIEEIMSGNSDVFQQKFYNKLQSVLFDFGLFIYYANINDVPGIETSTQIMMLHKEAEKRKEAVKQEADFQIFLKEQKVKITPSILKDIDLEREIEAKRGLMQIEKLRTEFLSKVTVDCEAKVQETKSEAATKQTLADIELYAKKKGLEAQRMVAEADLYTRQQAAKADQYEKQKQAESELFARQKQAEGELFVRKKQAEGELFAKRKQVEGELFAKTLEAEGLKTLAEPEGFDLNKIFEAFGGNYAAVRDFLLNKRVYPGVAKLNSSDIGDLPITNAKPVDGTEPVVAAQPAFAADQETKNNIVAGTLTLYQQR